MQYRVNFYDNESGKLFAYYTAKSLKDAMKMVDGNWSRARTEIVDHAKRSESSTESETL